MRELGRFGPESERDEALEAARPILQLAKARPRLVPDGRSLVPMARNPAVGAGRELLFENFFPASTGMRRGQWIYLEHPSGEQELYDLAKDPYQLNSLHASPSHAGLLGQLDARLDHPCRVDHPRQRIRSR